MLANYSLYPPILSQHSTHACETDMVEEGQSSPFSILEYMTAKLLAAITAKQLQYAKQRPQPTPTCKAAATILSSSPPNMYPPCKQDERKKLTIPFVHPPCKSKMKERSRLLSLICNCRDIENDKLKLNWNKSVEAEKHWKIESVEELTVKTRVRNCHRESRRPQWPSGYHPAHSHSWVHTREW